MSGTRSAAEARAAFDEVCNWGRWGDEDQRGTLNLIDDGVRRAAIATVTSGRSVSISQVIRPGGADDPVSLRMLRFGSDAVTCRDEVSIAPHGFATTHLDALSHCFFDSRAWNGRSADSVVGAAGLTFGDIAAFADGILTRGVLLDVAATRGMSFLDETDVVTPSDLDAAERHAGVRVRAGDAIVVRTGRAVAEQTGGADPARRAGIGLDCVRWLHTRDVAVYSGDCVDRYPSPVTGYPDYFHQIALAGMGLAMLDLPDVEKLRGLVEEEGRAWFLLQAAPLVIVGATGSAVNPIVTF